MDLNLRGKRALVTGGTKGIGRAIVEQLAAEGCDVALCARDAAGVAQAVATVEAHGVRGYGEALDVSDRGRLQSFVGAGAQALGGLDVVVCNVSALAMPNTESAWRQGLEVDILGTVNAVDAALPHLRASRAGSVVVISSTAALEIYAGLRAYNSVKAALIAYVAGLSQELASEGIRVNAVSPGSIYFDGGLWQQIERNDPDRYASAVKGTAMGRLGRPEEIARTVAFVASPAASFMTGSNVVVDGGLTRRIDY